MQGSKVTQDGELLLKCLWWMKHVIWMKERVVGSKYGDKEDRLTLIL